MSHIIHILPTTYILHHSSSVTACLGWISTVTHALIQRLWSSRDTIKHSFFYMNYSQSNKVQEDLFKKKFITIGGIFIQSITIRQKECHLVLAGYKYSRMSFQWLPLLYTIVWCWMLKKHETIKDFIIMELL